MHLWRRLRERLAEKRADREAIANARHEQMRAGDDPPKTVSETFDDTAGQFPPPQ
jgi:hypothetical protein